MEHLKYPIGRFVTKPEYTPEEVIKLIAMMETYPEVYRKLLESVSEEDAARTYREGSWTVKQLLHHVADIHLLNYLRLKKALVEPEHTAAVVDMNAWAAAADGMYAPVEDSLLMLEGINRRFVYMLKHAGEQVLNNKFYHPVRQIYLTVKQAVHMTVWHLAHHRAHIELALGLQPGTFQM